MFTHVGPARKTDSGNKRKAATGGGSADSGVAASGAVSGEPSAKRAKGKSKAWAGGGRASNGSNGGCGNGGIGIGSGSGSRTSIGGGFTRSAAAKAYE